MSFKPSGSEFRVNTYTPNQQRTFFESPQSIAMDADGDFVVTWSSYGQDGSGYGVYAQRYNAAGVAQGSEFLVNTATSYNQQYSTVAMDTDGDFVVTWSSYAQDGSGWGVYAQRYNATGVAQGSEFRVNTTTNSYQQHSTIAMDATGDFVVTWSSYDQDGSGWGVYAQRYNTAGVAQGSEFRVNTTTNNYQQYSTVAMDATGDFVVTWSSYNQDGSGWGVYAQRYNATGVAQGSEFRVNTTTNSYQQYSTVAMDTDGDFVVTWSSYGQDGSGWGVYAQRYNAAGVAQGGEFQVNTTINSSQLYSTVAMDADGDFVVTWTSYGQDGSSYGVYAQRYNAAGVAQGSEFLLNTTTSSSQLYSSVAMDAEGDFVVNWTSTGQDGSSYGVYAQCYQINKAPTTSGIGDVTVLEDAPNTVINLFAAFADDNDAPAKLTYKIVNSSNPSLFSDTKIDPITGQLILDYASNANGVGNITIRATDTEGLFLDTKFGVKVTSVNDVPTVANPLPNQAATEDSSFKFIIPANTFQDVDVGDSLTYKATLGDGNPLPGWLKFNADTRTFSGTPLNENVGTLSLKVTAIDTAGASVSNTFNLAIANTNDAPIVANAIANQSATSNSPFSFTFAGNTFQDIDVGDSLTYKAVLSDNTPLPSWLKFNAATRTFSGTPTTSDASTIGIKVTATDTAGTSVTDTFNLAIKNIVDGTSAANSLSGTAFDDLINGYGGNDVINSKSGNDLINGGDGNDKLVGDSGDDILNGAAGKDTLTGGVGNDQFIYNVFSERGDTIVDFGNASDVLNLVPLFDNLGYSGIDPIKDDYMRLVQKGVNTQVQIDPDGLTGSLAFSTLVTLNNFSAEDLIIGSNVLV
jgi:Ca2+-binding RTX toxin-like protein